MSATGKKRISTILISAGGVFLLAAVYGCVFVRPIPSWTNDALMLTIIITFLGLVLSRTGKRYR